MQYVKMYVLENLRIKKCQGVHCKQKDKCDTVAFWMWQCWNIWNLSIFCQLKYNGSMLFLASFVYNA